MPKRLAILLSVPVLFCFASSLFAENPLKPGLRSQPMTINGDNVEYSADSQEVTASGNVEIISGDTRLTCKKLTVNTRTKEGRATGGVRIEDGKGVIEGEEVTYNFETKAGTILDAQFRASPFFGRARKIDRENENEFVAHYGFATTCSFDHPHYRIGSKRMNVIPNQLIQTKDDFLYLGPFPVAYVSRFNQLFDKPVMHVSVLPGKRKDWGYYLLSEWTQNLHKYVDGRFYLDYRSKVGWAEGLGLNLNKSPIGSGDLKYYYTAESSGDYPNRQNAGYKSSYQRYLLRFRYKWDIDKMTNVVSEVYKIGDQKRKRVDQNVNFLQDYFYREFEKDSQPLNYALFHHSFSYSTLDILFQKRTNHWFDQVDKLPEASYVLPSIQLGETPFYFDSNSTFTTFNKKATTSPTSPDDLTVSRLDTTNKLSVPMKVAFLWFSPFVKVRETVYDKGADGRALPARATFYYGADLSTKFYRVFNIKTNLLGLDLNALRHVITPTIGYSYNPEPTVSANKLKQIDGIDLLASSNVVNLGLSNKLQTKRKNKDGKEYSVDLVDLDITTAYAFAPRVVYGITPVLLYNNTFVNESDPAKKNKLSNSTLTDIFFKLKVLPYSWLRIEADATYKRSGVTGDPDYENYNRFSTVNYDINFDLAPERSFGLGQRYARKGQNQVTASFKWRINPKWKFSYYQRYNLKGYTDTSVNPYAEVGKCSLEQQITLTRNLHCWDVDLTWGNKKNSGATIYLMFRMKAFPENEFGFDQSYNEPRSGAQ